MVSCCVRLPDVEDLAHFSDDLTIDVSTSIRVQLERHPEPTDELNHFGSNLRGGSVLERPSFYPTRRMISQAEYLIVSSWSSRMEWSHQIHADPIHCGTNPVGLQRGALAVLGILLGGTHLAILHPSSCVYCHPGPIEWRLLRPSNRLLLSQMP